MRSYFWDFHKRFWHVTAEEWDPIHWSPGECYCLTAGQLMTSDQVKNVFRRESQVMETKRNGNEKQLCAKVVACLTSSTLQRDNLRPWLPVYRVTQPLIALWRYSNNTLQYFTIK